MNKKDLIKKYLQNSPIKWKEIGFVMLPHKILFDDNLKSSDLMVYWVLMVHQFQGKSYACPSHLTIAEEARISRRTVIRSIPRLEKTGWVDIEKNKGKVSKYYVKAK